MLRSVVWLGVAFSFTLLVGPLAFVASQAGRTDPANLYIIIDAGKSTLSERQLVSFGASEVGPLRGILAKMVHAPPTAREQLLQSGYIMLPASALAALCRGGANQYRPGLRNS